MNSFRVSPIVIPTEVEESLNRRERDPSISLRSTRDDSQKLLLIFGNVEPILVITLNELYIGKPYILIRSEMSWQA